MLQRMYVCLQNRIPAWIISLIIVLILSAFTFSPVTMMAAGVLWSLLYWLVALLWCLFKALRHPDADAERQE